VSPLPCGSHISKTACQNRRMVKNERFQELDGRRFLVLRFDGQNQTQVRVGWPKMDLFLSKTTKVYVFKIIRLKNHQGLTYLETLGCNIFRNIVGVQHFPLECFSMSGSDDSV
jgi:hypothetical protein